MRCGAQIYLYWMQLVAAALGVIDKYTIRVFTILVRQLRQAHYSQSQMRSILSLGPCPCPCVIIVRGEPKLGMISICSMWISF